MADDGSQLTIRKLHPTIGAEVTGIDLAVAHSDAVIEQLRAAWVEHCVPVFHGQAISDAEQVAFSRRFGELEIFPQGANRSVSHREIFRVSNVDKSMRRAPQRRRVRFGRADIHAAVHERRINADDVARKAFAETHREIGLARRRRAHQEYCGVRHWPVSASAQEKTIQF